MLNAYFLLLALTIGQVQSDGERLLEQATAHYRALRSAEAARLYEAYLASYPDRADVRVFLGSALLNLEQPDRAMEQVRRAIELDKNYPRAYALAGRIHASGRHWELAEQAYQTALRLDPADRDAWYFLGRCYYEANRFTQALEALRRAVSLKAEFSRTYELLALTYDALTQYEEAERAYRRAVELAGKEYRPFLAYGVFLYRQGRMEESLDLLRKAAERNPAAAEAHFELGKVLLHLGRLAEAAQETSKALALSDECRFRYQLGRIYLRQGKPEVAERQMSKDCESR
jgi:tetratricopeptide (TPR) repeat protein